MKKHLLKKVNLEPTREDYLAIDRGEPNPKPGPEEEADLPPQFRAKETSGVRKRTPEQQAAHDWKMENWPRCRCECDDLFDMCLNCITHRQLTDLVQ